MEILLYNLPKVSLNAFFSRIHWTKRNNIKDTYKIIIRNQFKHVFSGGSFEVDYKFYFKNNPLDASNCVGMLKLIEDIIFLKDGFNDIQKISIESRKSDQKKDYVEINIKEITNYEVQ